MANFLIGPFLFFYLKTSLDRSKKLSNASKWHLGTLVIGIIIFGMLYPFSEHPIIWNFEIRYFIHSVLFLYTVLSASLLIKIFYKAFAARDELQASERGLLLVFLANTIICIGFVVSLKTSYALGAVWFSAVFYGVLTLLIFEKKRISVLGRVEVSNKRIEEALARSLIEKLKTLMTVEQRYKDSRLKLSGLAQDLQITPNRLSQLLNENIGKSFSEFVNEYRVAEAKRLLIENNEYTIEAIGYEAGFSSKSSFFSIFKKACKTTPSNFKNRFART